MAVSGASSASRSSASSARSSSASQSSSSKSSSSQSSSSKSASEKSASDQSANTSTIAKTAGAPNVDGTGNYLAAPETKAAAETARNSLQKGHGGQSVADMQRELNASGAKLEVDGKFGPKTDAAVRAYQANHGLAVDGKAGMNTLGSLYNDSRGRDAYAGKSTGSTPAAPTAEQTSRQPAGTTKAAAVQRPMNARGARAKPPAANTPNVNRAAKGDQHAVDRAAAQQGAQAGTRPKSGKIQDRVPQSGVDAAKTAAAAQSPAAKRGQPANKTASFDKISKTGQRNQMATGRITVNGNTYDFRSGGHGRGNLPKGDYKITKHRYSRGDASMSKSDAKGKVGFSYAMSDKYDARVGGNRSLLRIHPDGRGPGTMGCIGIVGNAETQRQFRNDMQAELARNGGSFNLRVG